MARPSPRPVIAILVATLLTAAPLAPAAGADEQSAGFAIVEIVSGYERPLYVTAHASPNRLYVVEQRGVIRVLRRTSRDAPWQKAGIFLDLRDRVAGPFVGRGLLGMAFHPDYAANGYFYVFYTRRHADPELHGDIVIEEYQRRTNLRANPGSARTVLVIPHPTSFHFGGWMGFGPDGYMFVTTGDAARVDFGFAQNLRSRLGKVLRFDPRKAAGQAGFIPADNPFVGRPGNDLVWAYGLRNPWRASFDGVTGDLWLSDVGQNHWEEVNRFSPVSAGSGANLGWTMCEGSHAYPPPDSGPAPCAATGVTQPVIEYPIADGNCSVIGGYVYRGASNPQLVGRYFFSDYCTGKIWSVPADHELGDAVSAPLETGRLITSFGVDALGELYVTVQGGRVFRIEQE